MIDLLARFAHVKPSGDGHTARCPAHDDQRASLSIRQKSDGRWLLNCHTGCKPRAIVAAVGLSMRDLFPDSGATTTARRIVATYRYLDESGALLFEVCRYEPKDFRARRPNARGGWIWNVKGVPFKLLRLPELRRIGDTAIVIVFGEKDVDNLMRIGVAATTNPFGEGEHKWRAEYTQQLLDAGITRVTILPDNDEAGAQHAARVARACADAGLRVQVLALPNLPPKGDVSDYLQHHTAADLRALIADAPAFAPTADGDTITPPRTLAEVEEIFKKWIRDPDPVPTRAVLASYVANRTLRGDPTWLMLVGGSGVGKTERLIPLAVMPDVVLESSITGPAALLSGSAKKDVAKNATGGLLRKLPLDEASSTPDYRAGVLLLKDFTSIIDMHRDARAEVLAALREVYDGRWDRSIGTDGGRTLTWCGHLGLIAGCTTAIDAAHAVVSTMGTRFLMVRLKGDQEVAGSAFDHVGEESAMRDELRAAVAGLLGHLPGAPHDKAEVRSPLIALASYVAAARSPVDRDQRSDIRLVLDAEAPTRIIKMLAQLWRASGALGLPKPEAWDMVKRVGLDSIPKLRRSILDYLDGCVVAATTTAIAEAVEHPAQTTRRALEDLTAHHVTERTAGGSGKADLWALTAKTRAWLEALDTFPVLSAGIYGAEPSGSRY